MILFWLVAMCGDSLWQEVAAVPWPMTRGGSCSDVIARPYPRPYTVSITEFGAVGDGITPNTKAFQNAIDHVADKGSALLYIPPGRWLTGSFGLTSHLTMWFHEDATLLGSTVPQYLLSLK